MSAQASPVAPARRTDDELLVRHVSDELVVLDKRVDVAHCLTPQMAQVWGLLDGRRTVAEVAEAAGLEQDVVEAVLVRFAETDLIDLPSHGDRRSFLRKGVLFGVAALAVPAIDSMLAPPAMAAGSRCGTANVMLTSCQDFTQAGYNGVIASNNFTVTLSGFPAGATYSATLMNATGATNAAGNGATSTVTGTFGAASAGAAAGTATINGTLGKPPTSTSTQTSPVYFHLDQGEKYSLSVVVTSGGSTYTCTYTPTTGIKCSNSAPYPPYTG